MSSSAPLFFRLDPECFKIVDDRIRQLRTGKLSITGFLLLLDADDPFILIDNTIYVLSPVEYYATKAIDSINNSVKGMFSTIMNMSEDELHIFNDKDKTFIHEVKEAKVVCTSCKYNRYKDSIYAIGKKYNIQPNNAYTASRKDGKVYPQTTSTIIPKVSALLSSMYKMSYEQRKACIDCVEKHVSQAYVLAQETYMGYPEHLTLVCAHLCEAIDEAPAEAVDLRDTLKYCLAYSKYTEDAFVPLAPIMAHIKLLRGIQAESPEATTDSRVEAPYTMELDITEDMTKEVALLPEATKKLLRTECSVLIDSVSNVCDTNRTAMTALFKGALACMAERVAATCTSFANMLRNRRLFFGADVATAKEAGYDFTDVMELLESKSKDAADN